MVLSVISNFKQPEMSLFFSLLKMQQTQKVVNIRCSKKKHLAFTEKNNGQYIILHSKILIEVINCIIRLDST